jgi:hypothetical protein
MLRKLVHKNSFSEVDKSDGNETKSRKENDGTKAGAKKDCGKEDNQKESDDATKSDDAKEDDRPKACSS